MLGQDGADANSWSGALDARHWWKGKPMGRYCQRTSRGIAVMALVGGFIGSTAVVMTTAGRASPATTGVTVAGAGAANSHMVNGGCSGSLPSGTVVAMAAPPNGSGYWIVNSQGQVVTCGDATNLPSLSFSPNLPVVGMASTPDGGGAWLVASDGGIFALGDAHYFGSTGAIHLNLPIVGMTSTADGGGYWLVAADGGVFAFGDAAFYGSTGAIHLNKPVVGMAVDAATGGYWLVAADGGIFAFNAPFYGSTGAIALNKSVVGMSSMLDGSGYRLVAADGGIFSFGAPFYGSTGNIDLNEPIVGMASEDATGGYWLVATDGGIFAFNAPFYGSAVASPPSATPAPQPATSTSTTLVYDADGPDPSWLPVYYGVAEVYTTDAVITGGQWAHVPTYATTLVNPQSSTPVDALATLPSLSSGDIWAPSVRFLGGQFVMVFSESVAGRANCIGWATSSNGHSFTPDNGLSWCSPNPSVGYLDPYVFVDAANGTVWLVYSQQGAALGSVSGSELVTHQLTANGLGFTPGSQDDTLITYAQVSSLNSNPGSNPEIENPSMTSDASGYFDLTFSLGTWTSNSTYLTGEVLCLSNMSGCIPSQGTDVMNGGGGASALLDSSASNWLIWHSWSGSNRVDYTGPTSEANSGDIELAPALARSKAGALRAFVTRTPTQVVPYTWRPRVPNPTDPHLVIGYTGRPTTIPSDAAPVADPTNVTTASR